MQHHITPLTKKNISILLKWSVQLSVFHAANLMYWFQKVSFPVAFPCTLKPLLYNVFPPLLWYQSVERKLLSLTHGSSALVLELGVEEIAAADGGDVEACLLTLCQSFAIVVSLSLSLFLCVCLFFAVPGILCA
jgi:hypothetical protein